jgi:hypothetical protein
MSLHQFNRSDKHLVLDVVFNKPRLRLKTYIQFPRMTPDFVFLVVFNRIVPKSSTSYVVERKRTSIFLIEPLNHLDHEGISKTDHSRHVSSKNQT